jgi:hypothetical protein
MTTPTMYAPCGPWADVDDFDLCSAADYPDGVLADAVAAATALMFVKLGREFTGECVDTWRPCGLWGCGCADYGGCHCHRYPAVRLRHWPPIEIDEVRVNGEVLPSDAYQLGQDNDYGTLLRVDGEQWPCCQDIAGDPEVDEDTWQIVYGWGVAPPAGTGRMVELLACELAKGWKTGKCRLPRRVSTITRENVTMTILDNFEIFQQGLTGIEEVDLFLSTFNPSGKDRAPKVLNPDLLGLGVTDPGAADARHVQNAATQLATGGQVWRDRR